MKSKTRAPFLRYRYPARFVRLFIGLVLFGLSSALNVRSMLGLSPWNAFHQGLSLVSGLSIGRITQLCGIVIIGIDLLMREPIGFGTIFNMILVGGSLDFFLASGLIPETDSLFWRAVETSEPSYSNLYWQRIFNFYICIITYANEFVKRFYRLFAK